MFGGQPGSPGFGTTAIWTLGSGVFILAKPCLRPWSLWKSTNTNRRVLHPADQNAEAPFRSCLFITVSFTRLTPSRICVLPMRPSLVCPGRWRTRWHGLGAACWATCVARPPWIQTRQDRMDRFILWSKAVRFGATQKVWLFTTSALQLKPCPTAQRVWMLQATQVDT